MKKNIRDRVIRDFSTPMTLRVTKSRLSDFMSSECQHIKRLNNLKDVSVPVVSKVLTVKQDKSMF
jgi:predicted XRE-type DNA-binding protein